MKKTVNSCRIENRRAHYDYVVLNKLECGIALRGTEVKSIRHGMAGLKGSWCSVDNGQLVLHGMHVTAYEHSDLRDFDEDRDRVLLAHKYEIRKLQQEVKEKGVTLIPLALYFSKGRAKVELGVCRGKRLKDYRLDIMINDINRDIERSLKEENYG